MDEVWEPGGRWSCLPGLGVIEEQIVTAKSEWGLRYNATM